MIDTPAGEGNGTFGVQGTSTGGLWDKLPPIGHPLLPTTGALIGGAGDFQLPRTYRVSLGVRF